MALEDELLLLDDVPEEGLDVFFEDVAEVPEEGLVIDDESPNIVADLKANEEGQKVLRDVAKQGIKDFDSFYESSEEFRQRQADNYKIYAGFLPPKTFPWEGCSNAHIPLMLEGISRLSARTYAEIFLNDDQVWSFAPTGPDDELWAEALTKHTNWQFKNIITDFTRQMHRALVIFFTNGDVTARSFYDSFRGRNCHEIVTSDDFFTPYVHVTTEPDYSDVPAKVLVLRLKRHELERMRGEWEDIDLVLERQRPSYDDEPEALLRAAHADVDGLMLPDDDEGADFKLYLYDGWFTFPGDEQARAIQAVIDPATRTVLKLFIREEPDWQDQLRYENDLKDGEDYALSMQMWEQDQAERQALRDQMMDPMVDPGEADLINQGMDAEELPPPPPPSWMSEGKDAPDSPRMVAIEMYSHGVCMENFLGSHGLSYGQILADQNRAINNNLNLFNDAASLANVSTFFMPDTFDIEPGPVSFQPGSINRVTGVSGPEIKNSIVEVRAQPANPQLMEGAQQMYEWAQASVAANASLSGEPGKSGETYRGLAMRVEQALKQLSVSGHKFCDFLVQIGRNNNKLNSMFLREEELFYVTDHFTKRGEQLRVERKMYQRNYSVSIRSDLRFASQAQRIAEADEMVALPNAIPMLQGNVAWNWAAAAKALRARGMHDMLPMLGPAPPPPTTPLGLPPPPPPGMMPPGPPGAAPPGPPGPPGPPPPPPAGPPNGVPPPGSGPPPPN